MDALTSMQSFLRSRPSKFKSLDYAIEWSVRSGQVRNTASARVSMPAQLKCIKSDTSATEDIGKQDKAPQEDEIPTKKPPIAASNSIAEEDEEKEGEEESSAMKAPGVVPISAPTPDENPGYTWRIDLAATEQHWPGWFQGLSEKFLSVPASKLLLLAGVDRLDR